jgi:hypothetical protein
LFEEGDFSFFNEIYIPSGLEIKLEDIRMRYQHQLSAVIMEIFLEEATIIFLSLYLNPTTFSLQITSDTKILAERHAGSNPCTFDVRSITICDQSDPTT